MSKQVQLAVLNVAPEVKECCSVEGYITGIMFYDGFTKLTGFTSVGLVREPGNHHDCNAVLAVLESGTVLGHLDSKTAAVVAPLMDMKIPNFLIKTSALWVW